MTEHGNVTLAGAPFGAEPEAEPVKRARKPRKPKSPLVVQELSWTTQTDPSVGGRVGLYATSERAQRDADLLARLDPNRVFAVNAITVTE